MKQHNVRHVLCLALIVGAAACKKQDATETPADAARASAADAKAAAPAPTLGPQLDRAGRVAVSTGLIETFNPNKQQKQAGKRAFNTAGPDRWSSFAGKAAGSLAILDGLDGACGNQLLADPKKGKGRYDVLAGVLMDDRLYVDTSRSECTAYLGLEAELVGAVPKGKGGCGGRTPVQDVIETTYSVLAAGALSGVDDTLPPDTSHSITTFPFLAKPQ